MATSKLIVVEVHEVAKVRKYKNIGIKPITCLLTYFCLRSCNLARTSTKILCKTLGRPTHMFEVQFLFLFWRRNRIIFKILSLEPCKSVNSLSLATSC